jgi:hypothetical protein
VSTEVSFGIAGERKEQNKGKRKGETRKSKELCTFYADEM